MTSKEKIQEIRKEKPYLGLILDKMCQKIGITLEEINFNDPQWFSKYSWTEKQEKEFSLWMQKYLMEKEEARKEILAIPSKNKKNIKRATVWFLFNYGWPIKEKK